MEEWLLSMDSRGFALTHAMCRDMANLLLRARELTPSETLPKVGKNWVIDFIKRYDSLASYLSRRYDYRRALSEDPKLIKGWFDLVRNTIQNPADIGNLMRRDSRWVLPLHNTSYVLRNTMVNERFYKQEIVNGLPWLRLLTLKVVFSRRT